MTNRRRSIAISLLLISLGITHGRQWRRSRQPQPVKATPTEYEGWRQYMSSARVVTAMMGSGIMAPDLRKAVMTASLDSAALTPS
jgi:hypothetical protein